MAVVMFDVDGTLRDNTRQALTSERLALQDLGFSYDRNVMKANRHYASSGDWKNYFGSFGVPPDLVDDVVRQFFKHFKQQKRPVSIPKAKETLSRIQAVVGLERMHFITNSEGEEVAQWMRSSAMEEYVDRMVALITVDDRSICKSDEIVRISRMYPNENVAFVGDAISDYDSCKVARQKGIEQLKFYGPIHRYSICNRCLVSYIERDHDKQYVVGKLLDDIAELPPIIKDLTQAERHIMGVD